MSKRLSTRLAALTFYYVIFHIFYVIVVRQTLNVVYLVISSLDSPRRITDLFFSYFWTYTMEVV